MARTIYGAELYKSPDNSSNFEYILGKNSEVLALGDVVTIDPTDGLKRIGTAFSGTNPSVFGVVGKTVTLSSTNETVAQVTVPVIPIDKRYYFLMGTNSDLQGTAVGSYYKLIDLGTGTTSVQVDVSTGTTTVGSAVVLVVDVDPLNEGGSGAGSGKRQVVIQFVHTQSFMS